MRAWGRRRRLLTLCGEPVVSHTGVWGLPMLIDVVEMLGYLHGSLKSWKMCGKTGREKEDCWKMVRVNVQEEKTAGKDPLQ